MNDTIELAATADLETLYQRLGMRSVGAGWNKKTPSLYPEPKKNFVPFQWHWKDGKAALNAAGRLIDTNLAERRNLILQNPGDPNDYATVHTLICAYQMILPGEKARSHRHTPNALRFVLDGEGSYTIVDGDRLDMHPNDVLLTPNWCYHGHASEAKGACSWMDCLDVPMVHFMEPMFYEQHPDDFEPVRSTPLNSDYLFAWDQVQSNLDRTTLDPEGRFGRRIELGSPALNSTGLHMNRLAAGMVTRRTRTTANQIFCVVEGTGTSTIDGKEFIWERGDIVAIPSWRPFEHKINTDATLFEMSDEPLIRAMGWLRTAD